VICPELNTWDCLHVFSELPILATKILPTITLRNGTPMMSMSVLAALAHLAIEHNVNDRAFTLASLNTVVLQYGLV